MAKNNEIKDLETLLSESNIDAEINSILEELGTNDAPEAVDPADVEKPEAGEPGAGFAPEAVKTGETEVSPSKDSTVEDKEVKANDIGAQPVVEGCVKEDGSVLDQNPVEKTAIDAGNAQPGVAEVDEVKVIPSAIQDPVIAPEVAPTIEPVKTEVDPLAGLGESFANIFSILSDNINEAEEETFKAGFEDYKDNGKETIAKDQVETSTSNADYFKDEKIGDDMNEKQALQEAKKSPEDEQFEKDELARKEKLSAIRTKVAKGEALDDNEKHILHLADANEDKKKKEKDKLDKSDDTADKVSGGFEKAAEIGGIGFGTLAGLKGGHDLGMAIKDRKEGIETAKTKRDTTIANNNSNATADTKIDAAQTTYETDVKNVKDETRGDILKGSTELGLGGLLTLASIGGMVAKHVAKKKKQENNAERKKIDEPYRGPVVEQVALTVAYENNDRLFSELVEATALANRLKNAICEKYNDVASKRADSLLEEIKVWNASCEDSVEEPDAYVFENQEFDLEDLANILEDNDVEVNEDNLVEFARGFESGDYILEEVVAGEAATPVRVAKTASESNYYTTDFAEKGDVDLKDANDNDMADGEQKANYDVHCHGDVELKDGGANMPEEGAVSASESDWFDDKELIDVKEVIVESEDFIESIKQFLESYDYEVNEANVALIKESFLNSTLNTLDENLTEAALMGNHYLKKAVKLASKINKERGKGNDTSADLEIFKTVVDKAKASGAACTWSDQDGRIVFTTY